ncbi:MAG TPA: hypothetical protein VGB82_13245 [Alphaproteobacteria bacterium]
MATIYVSRSQNLQQWGSDVGLTAHLYKVAVTNDSAESAVESLNAAKFCGESDWRLVKAQSAEIDEATALERLGRKEKPVDTAHYPRLGGATGLVKVKLANVQSRLLVQRMMAGEEEKPIKPKPADIGAHLIQDALG